MKKNLEDMKSAALGASKLATLLLEKLGLSSLIPTKAADTAATGASSAANVAWQATAWPILLITLAIAAAMLVLVGVVMGVVAIFNAMSDAYNKDAIAAENAETAAKNLAAAYDEAK
jgi:hypothetical protein